MAEPREIGRDIVIFCEKARDYSGYRENFRLRTLIEMLAIEARRHIARSSSGRVAADPPKDPRETASG